MMRWCSIALVSCLFVIASCAKSSDPAQGSQTHFLQSCDDSCPAPYDCLCGVCTIACTEDAMCGEHAEAASCVAVSDSCMLTSNVCDLACERDDDCATLGSSFECSAGQCREPSMSRPDAGGDGDGDGDGDTPDDLGPLCDGSKDMRLGFTSEGGQVEVTYDFTHPYGHAFFFVDGECNFYASTDARDGLRVGKLTADEAEQLANTIQWEAIPELAAEADVESCPDAGALTLWAPGYQVSCTCGCPETPVGDRQSVVLAYLNGYLDMSAVVADRADTPVLAIASPNDAIPDATAWPLDRAIDAVPSLVHDVYADGVESFALFDRYVDIGALRQLRNSAQDGRLIAVTDASGTYDLHLRDAFPAGVQQRIHELLGRTVSIDPVLGELCDGSTDLRLGYSADGGFVDVTFYFTNPHGHWFVFVDGQCNYYVSMGYLEGVQTGALDAQQAEELAANVGWDSFDELTVEDIETCSDAGASSIWAPDGRRMSCTCGCDEGPVSMRKMDALSYMTELMSNLAMQGQSVSGPVSALAAEASPTGSELAWPLDGPIASFPNLVHDLDDLGPNPQYASFEDVADASALRLLREQQQPGTPLSVTDGQATYQLWVRDEIPAAVSEAIESFTAEP